MTTESATKWNLWLVLAISVGYWVLLFFLTHSEPGNLGAKGYDKLAHFVAYGLLAVLLSTTVRAMGLRGWQWQVAVLAVCICYGAVDEYLQLFVPGRRADWLDLLADALGAATALILLQFVRKR